MSFWPFPARSGTFAAFIGLLLSHWYDALTSATVAVGVLYCLLVLRK